MKHPHVDWIMKILSNPPKPIKKDGLWVIDSNRRLMIVEYQDNKLMTQRELTPQLLVALCKEVIRLNKIYENKT